MNGNANGGLQQRTGYGRGSRSFIDLSPSPSQGGRTALHIACAHTDNHAVSQTRFNFICLCIVSLLKKTALLITYLHAISMIV